MKKYLFVIILILLLTLVSRSIAAERYEGQVVGIDVNQRNLILQMCIGDQIVLEVDDQAELYYNNQEADLGMYQPVTESDFVNGYVETNEEGQVEKAYFYYLVREGLINELENTKLVLEDVESGICDSYSMRSDLEVSLNDSTVKISDLAVGMRVIMVLDYKFQVKKVAAFHYDFVGLIEKVNLAEEKIVVNVGTRLTPNYQEFSMGGKVEGSCQDWAGLNSLAQNNPLLLAKFIINKNENSIAFINICSL